MQALIKATGNRVNNWFNQKSTQEFLTALNKSIVNNSVAGIPASAQPQGFEAVLDVNKGGTPQKQGTWAIDEVAVDFAHWCNVEFRIWVNRTIKEIMFGQFQPTPNHQSYLASRILDVPNPWVRLYEPEFCQTVFSWFGAQFYWIWLYNFLTPEEQAKLNRLNPYNVTTGDRARRIHQYISSEARERLTKHVDQLTTVATVSTSAQDFLTRMARLQKSNQLELKI